MFYIVFKGKEAKCSSNSVANWFKKKLWQPAAQGKVISYYGSILLYEEDHTMIPLDLHSE